MARPPADSDPNGADPVTDNLRLSPSELMNMLVDAQDERDGLRLEVTELRDACDALNAELRRLREQLDQLRSVRPKAGHDR